MNKLSISYLSKKGVTPLKLPYANFESLKTTTSPGLEVIFETLSHQVKFSNEVGHSIRRLWRKGLEIKVLIQKLFLQSHCSKYVLGILTSEWSKCMLFSGKIVFFDVLTSFSFTNKKRKSTKKKEKIHKKQKMGVLAFRRFS